jgi:type II secretory pathway pseudopilin PulG
MRRADANRRGFVLPAAIMALVLLSALVAGALYVSTEELRSGRDDVVDQRVLSAAESALDRAILQWDPLQNTRGTIGSSVVTADSATPNVRVTVSATRVQPRAVWMTAEAVALDPGSRVPVHHTLGASLRLVTTSVPGGAALATLGAVTVVDALVDGRATASVPDALGVCAPDDTVSVAGIALPDPARVACSACSSSGDAGVLGNPAVAAVAISTVDSTANQSLIARATITLPGGSIVVRPVVRDGQCDRSDALNWGTPDDASACGAYFPIIHVRGDVVLAPGSVGQGVLVVDGTLRIEANALFVGAVIASGAVIVDGPRAEIRGAVRVADRGGSGSSIVNGGAIRFARCALQRAALGSATLARTPERWWTELR